MSRPRSDPSAATSTVSSSTMRRRPRSLITIGTQQALEELLSRLALLLQQQSCCHLVALSATQDCGREPQPDWARYAELVRRTCSALDERR